MKDDVFDKSNNLIPIERQKQLRFPKGKEGEVVGKILFNGNAEVIDIVVNLVEFKKGLKICDIGCGPGYSLIKLSEKLPRGEIVGLDPSVEMLRQASENNKRSIESGLVKVIKGKTPNTNLDLNYFDYVLLNNVIYFWDELKPHIKELQRISKPEGKIIIYMADVEEIKIRIGSLGEIFNLYTVKDVKNEFEVEGFTLEDDHYIKRNFGGYGNMLVFNNKVINEK